MPMRDSLKHKSVLIYQFSDGNGSVEIRWDSYDAVERRHTYYYRIRTGPDFMSAVAHEADGPRSGSGDPISLPHALASVLDFLAAFAESRRYGTGPGDTDNWDLFPDHLAQWAEGMNDEFALAREEIDSRI